MGTRKLSSTNFRLDTGKTAATNLKHITFFCGPMGLGVVIFPAGEQ